MSYLYDMDSRSSLYFDVVTAYKYFLDKMESKRNDRELSDRENVMISGFLDWIDQQYTYAGVDVYFLYWYFSYQIHFYIDGGNLSKRSFLGWIVGSKARQRWIDRNPYTYQRQISERFYQKFSPQFDEFQYLLRPAVIDLYADEEAQRAIMFGTSSVLSHCYLTTTLYDSRSKYCCRCDYRENCKILQQATYERPTVQNVC